MLTRGGSAEVDRDYELDVTFHMFTSAVRTLALLCVLLFGASTFSLAQLGTEGSILGIVQDPSGGSVVGAPVTVTNTDTGLAKSAVTDERGYFQVVALPPGSYSVRVAAPGSKLGR